VNAAWTRPFRRHPLTWAAPLAAIVLNLAWLSAFGSGARLRAADLDSRLERARTENTEATALLAERESLWITATENRDRVDKLRREVFSTERARLTAMVREVKDLASRSGLAPSTIRYPEESFSDFGLSRRSIDFSVEGGYDDLRTFLHLLELTPTFVTVDDISVTERDAGRLGISLRLSTLFVEGGADEATTTPSPPPGPTPVAAPPEAPLEAPAVEVPPIEVPPYEEDDP
jgi:Tfp pilus assembly protein PilO